MNLIYDVKDKPKFGQLIVFAFQQLLAILAATIAVPAIIGNGMQQSAALFGAGVGTMFTFSSQSSEALFSSAPHSHFWALWRRHLPVRLLFPQAIWA